jgi:hypothetical protein
MPSASRVAFSAAGALPTAPCERARPQIATAALAATAIEMAGAR